MAYEQIISFSTVGTQGLQQGVTLTDKLSESTKRVNDLLYGEGTATEKLTLQIAKLATEETKLEQIRERHRTQNDALAASAARSAAGQEVFSTSTVKATGSVRDMTNALRVLEGGMPIRAAATFLSTIGGIGPILSAAFPIIGAIALFGVVEKIADKLGLQINIWKRIEDAQKSSNEQLKEASSEYDGLIRKLKQLQDEEYKRKAGPIEAARNEAFEFQQKAQTVDAQRIQLLEKEINAIRPYTTPSPYAPGPGSQQAIYGGLAGLTTAGESLSTVGSGIQVKAAKALLPGLEKELSAARLQQEADQASAIKSAAQEDKEIDTRNKERARTAESASREAQAAEARNAGFERSASEAYGRAYFGDEASPQRKLAIANQRIQDERTKALGEKGADPERVNKAFDLEKIAAFMEFVAGSSAALKKFNEMLDRGGESIDKEIAKRAGTVEDVGFDPSVLDNRLPIPKGYVSPTEGLRNARRAGAYGIRAVRGSESPGEQEAAQVSAADAEYKAQLRVNAEKLSGAALTIANLDAEDAKKEKIFQAEQQREDAILEFTNKQKEAFQNLAIGLFDSAKSGNVAGFIKGELNKVLDTVVGNAAGSVWKSISGVIPHAGAGTALGTLLQGTPFGPDPMKTAGVDLIKAASDLSMAAAKLSAISPSGGGGGAGGYGGPGIGGSGVGASGDYGGEFGPAVPVPSAATASASGDYGGEFGPAVPVPSASKGLSATATAAKAATIAAGAYAAYSGFKAGGAQGSLQGVAAVAGTASAIDPEPVSRMILAGIAATAGLVAAVLGDPKQNRANQIAGELKYNQYMAPVAINASMTTGGTYADYDRFGQSRGSDLSPFPTIEQGFFDYRHNTVVPGRTDSQFGGRGGGTPVNVYVQTLDSKSFNDNSHLVADAVQHALQTGRATGLQETMRNL